MAHGLEVDLDQFAQGTARSQPAIGSAFRAGHRHAPDDGADRGRTLATVEPQPAQQRDQLHLLHGPQPDLFDSHTARSQQLQRIDVDAVELFFRSVILRLLGTRQGNLTGEQLSGDAVRFLLDLARRLGQRQNMLGTQDLLDPGTQQRPIGLRDSEVATEIEQGTLADAGAAAFGADQAMGEVAFAVGGRAGLGAADEHGMRRRYEVGRGGAMPLMRIMALHWPIPTIRGQEAP